LAGPWSSVDIAVRVSIPWENSRAVMAETTGAMTRATPATRERKETMVACVVGDGEVCVWSCVVRMRAILGMMMRSTIETEGQQEAALFCTRNEVESLVRLVPRLACHHRQRSS